jgi:hypothetical protein
VRFQHGTEVIDFLDIISLECSDGEATVRLRRDQALILQGPKGLANRDAARPKNVGELFLAKAGSGLEDAIENGSSYGDKDDFLAGDGVVSGVVDDLSKAFVVTIAEPPAEVRT